mgnify:CR=1 FL=1
MELRRDPLLPVRPGDLFVSAELLYDIRRAFFTQGVVQGLAMAIGPTIFLVGGTISAFGAFGSLRPCRSPSTWRGPRTGDCTWQGPSTPSPGGFS